MYHFITDEQKAKAEELKANNYLFIASSDVQYPDLVYMIPETVLRIAGVRPILDPKREGLLCSMPMSEARILEPSIIAIDRFGRVR